MEPSSTGATAHGVISYNVIPVRARVKNTMRSSSERPGARGGEAPRAGLFWDSREK